MARPADGCSHTIRSASCWALLRFSRFFFCCCSLHTRPFARLARSCSIVTLLHTALAARHTFNSFIVPERCHCQLVLCWCDWVGGGDGTELPACSRTVPSQSIKQGFPRAHGPPHPWCPPAGACLLRPAAGPTALPSAAAAPRPAGRTPCTLSSVLCASAPRNGPTRASVDV